MDQAMKDRVQHELEDEANRLFSGAVRQAALLEHGDDPGVEPGELVLQLAVVVPPGEHGEAPEPHTVLKQPAMKQFRQEVSQRLPEVRKIQIRVENADGEPYKGMFLIRTDDEARPADGDLTPVMARLRPAELEIVDTLISAGIAANRAEVIRWALARISERPAYAQLRQHTRDIERLKAEF